MRRLLLVLAVFLALPGVARAAEQTLVFTSSPVTIGAYGVARGVQGPIASPKVDGYVVGMSADVVDSTGAPVPNAQVMLHHVVFAKVLAPDYTCTSFRGYDGKLSAFPAQRFYAEGEEHLQMALPSGYGYANRATDMWGLLYMLMNHHPHAMTVQVRYTVRYVTGESLAPVKPVWLDVRNCEADPVFNVPGAGRAGSSYSATAQFTMPESGWFVAGGAHLHGGGRQISVVNTTCGTPIYDSYPTWGGPMPTPVMHEPGPMAMTEFAESPGRGVRAGDAVRITARYDDAVPHVRVMGIAILYFAPGPVVGCEPYASVVPPPTTPMHVRVPLLRQPAGSWRHVTSTWVGDYRFGAQRVTLRRGTTFTWRFVGKDQHDVTLATGPEGFASPTVASGTFRFRFKRPGTYKLFCSIHPSRMTQVVLVR